MPVAISNSSTLIHLAAIGRLALLREFYGKITIPPAVWREVVEEGKGRAGAVEVEGKIISLRQELERLGEDAGFWISEHLYRRALEAVGESVR